MRVSEWQSKDPNSTSGDTNIWRVDTSSGEVIRLSDGQFDATPVCSPDGKWIYYVQPNGAEPKFQRVSIDGRTSKTVIAMQVLPGIDISRNGKLLSFWSGDEFGVVDIERGKVLRKFSIDPLMYLANGQATYPRFTPDDEALSYARRVDGVDNLWARPSMESRHMP